MLNYWKPFCLAAALISTLPLVQGSPKATTTTAVACVETNVIQDPSFESTKSSPWINFHGSVATSNRDITAEDLGRYLSVPVPESRAPDHADPRTNEETI